MKRSEKWKAKKIETKHKSEKPKDTTHSNLNIKHKI